MISPKDDAQNLSPVEGIKRESRYLRGTILDNLADESTGDVTAENMQVLKFHGTYLQDDRDERAARRRAKLEKAFSFMIRVRVPGGVCTPQQWLEIDRLAGKYANGTIKLTTRQAFQLHGVLKGNLKPTIAEINHALLDTIAACGDVNRNVMCNPNPEQSAVHQEVYEISAEISRRLTPQTHAYHEIWLDGEKVVTSEEEVVEPLYGETYLPRKFKTGVAIPPMNDVDIFTQDLGFIAIVEEGELVGFNVTAGGGMGMSHSNTATFPRLADVLGFVTKDQVIPAAEAVLTTQRDYGDRQERKHARLKYTIEDRGVEWFREETAKRMGFAWAEAKPFHFDRTTDRYGWTQTAAGDWHLNLFIQNGRVLDTDDFPMRTGLREIAKVHDGDFRLTPNQHLVIGRISEEKKPEIEALLKQYGLDATEKETGLRLNSMACVALPTCGLALAESERKLPAMLVDIEQTLRELGLEKDEITIRMTGCPNGCARPYNAEIGLVGKAPGKYNLYLGASFDGARLNKLHRSSMKEPELLEEIKRVLGLYAQERQPDERFGDFCIRTGIVKPTLAGRDFHNDLAEEATA